MKNNSHDVVSTVPWRALLFITLESVLAFFIASFCMAIFITQHGANWLTSAIILVLLYLFVIVVVSKRVLEKLPIAAVMLIIPIAPFIALMMILALIPILQKLL